MSGIGKVGGPGKGQGAQSAPATADPADVHAMRAAMAEEPGEPPLSSLFSRQGAAASEAEKALAADPDGKGSGGAEAGPDEDDVAAEVAERVLVTDREYSDDEEVRIYLKDSVLRGTEVHLRRRPDTLEVRVETTDRESHEILLDAKDSLARRLEASCDVGVRLDIVYVRGTD